MAAPAPAASPDRGRTYPRYPHYPQADSPFPNRAKLTASGRGRRGGGPATERQIEGRKAQAEGAVAPPRTLAPEAEGTGGGRSRARIGASGCEAGFHETSMAAPEGSLRAGGSAEPATAAGIAPWPEPAGRRGRALRPSRDPDGVEREGFGLRRLREKGKAFGRSLDPKGDFERFRPRVIPRKAGRLRPNVFRKGDRRGFGLDASLRRRRGFGRA